MLLSCKHNERMCTYLRVRVCTFIFVDMRTQALCSFAKKKIKFSRQNSEIVRIEPKSQAIKPKTRQCHATSNANSLELLVKKNFSTAFLRPVFLIPPHRLLRQTQEWRACPQNPPIIIFKIAQILSSRNINNPAVSKFLTNFYF